jgi:hypothetical protein
MYNNPRNRIVRQPWAKRGSKLGSDSDQSKASYYNENIKTSELSCTLSKGLKDTSNGLLSRRPGEHTWYITYWYIAAMYYFKWNDDALYSIQICDTSMFSEMINLEVSSVMTLNGLNIYQTLDQQQRMTTNVQWNLVKNNINSFVVQDYNRFDKPYCIRYICRNDKNHQFNNAENNK